MKAIALLVVLSAGTIAKADIFRCGFTEPFISTHYSTTSNELIVSVAGEKPIVEKNVSFQIKGPAEFELLSLDKKVIMTLKLTGQGSDGMSNIIYPYEASYNATQGSGLIIGGCSSNFLPPDRSQDDSDHN